MMAELLCFPKLWAQIFRIFVCIPRSIMGVYQISDFGPNKDVVTALGEAPFGLTMDSPSWGCGYRSVALIQKIRFFISDTLEMFPIPL